MINKVLFIFLFFFLSIRTSAQLGVTYVNTESLDNLENLLVSELLGCNVDISNIQFSGNMQSFGSFSYTQNNDICEGGFELDRGILMTNGDLNHAVGPNNDGDDGQAWGAQYVDTFLHNYLVDFGVITQSSDLYDASVLEFDIEASALNSLNFEVVFGSEEYVEWMTPFYADAFCFFVSEVETDIDPNIGAYPQNIMETGDVVNLSPNASLSCNLENKPISVWTIRPYSQIYNTPGLNECLFLDNENGQFCDAIGYDGYTVPMFFNFNMLPGAKYHIKMVIVDGAGPNFDSGVFIKKANTSVDPLIDFTWQEIYNNNLLGTTVSFSNVSSTNMNFSYFWDFDGDGNIDSTEPNPIYTFDESGDYMVTLDVVNDCTGFVSSISYSIAIDTESVNLLDSIMYNVSIFPNPTSHILNISVPDKAEKYTIEFLDLSCRTIYKHLFDQSSAYIDVSSIKSGVYFINIYNGLNIIHTQKLVIL